MADENIKMVASNGAAQLDNAMAVIPPQNAQYSFASPRRQLFSFPQDVIASMLNNPSSHKGLLKLYQTCKYFYGKRPILIAGSVKIENHGANIFVKVEEGCREYDVTRFQERVWATDYFWVAGNPGTTFQQFPKLYRFSIKHLIIMGCSLRYNDFLTLAAEKSILSLSGNVQFFQDDMSKTPIENVLAIVPAVSKLTYEIDKECHTENLKSLLDDVLITLPTLEMIIIEFVGLNHTFDMNIFCEFATRITDAESTICFNVSSTAKEAFNDAMKKLDNKWSVEGRDNLMEALRDIY